MKNKFVRNIPTILIMLLMLSFVVSSAFAYDSDLSNLTSTDSVTVEIGEEHYTVNNTSDIDGLIALDKAILEYRSQNEANAYSVIYNQLQVLLVSNATVVTSISGQTISSGNRIWLVDNTTSFSGTLTLTGGNLLILTTNGSEITFALGAQIDINGGNLIVQGKDNNNKLLLNGGGRFTRNGNSVTINTRRTKENMIYFESGGL